MKKLPSTLICSAEGCNFRHEDEEYARMLAEAGVEVTIKRFKESGHGFIPHFRQEWKEAVDFITREIKRH